MKLFKTDDEKQLDRTRKALADITRKCNNVKETFNLQMQIEKEKFDIEKIALKLKNPREELMNHLKTMSKKKGSKELQD